MNRTVIITSGTSAEAQKLAKQYANDQVFFADSMPVPLPFLNSGKFIQLPNLSAPHFIHELLKACLNQSADLLVILSAEEIQMVSPEKILFEEYNIKVVC